MDRQDCQKGQAGIYCQYRTRDSQVTEAEHHGLGIPGVGNPETEHQHHKWVGTTKSPRNTAAKISSCLINYSQTTG